MATMEEVGLDDRQLPKGDCFKVQIIFKETVDGPVIDLTGYDALFACDDLVGANNWFADVSSTISGPGAGTVEIDGPNGMVTAICPSSVTENWAVQKKSVKYQLALIEPEGCRDTLLMGSVEVIDAPIENVGG